MQNLIYLDNNSTTKVEPRVMEAMIPYFLNYYGNASSNHDFGVASNEAVRVARNSVAELLNCGENEVFFTSGATESINLALKGIIKTTEKKTPHIITLQTEHPAVIDCCRWLEKEGVRISFLPVNNEGLINLQDLKNEISNDTVLISIMYVNNETGVIQPIKEISEIAHEHNILFMCDATQAVGRIPVSVYELGIDILCFSGHKFYGPKGIGGIFLRSKRPFKAKIPALLHGGGHEKGLRSGTLNVPGIVGLGKAASLALKEMKNDSLRIEKFRDKLENSLLNFSNATLNGSKRNRIYNTSNICFGGIDADAIIVGLKNIAVSNGSACTSMSVEPSHVLKAMGKSDNQAFSSIRFSLGKFTTENEISQTLLQFPKVISHLKEIVK